MCLCVHVCVCLSGCNVVNIKFSSQLRDSLSDVLDEVPEDDDYYYIRWLTGMKWEGCTCSKLSPSVCLSLCLCLCLCLSLSLSLSLSS